MDFDGIKGDVTESTHDKWIELSSLQFGVGRGIGGTAPGASKGREASLCNISEITVSKPADSASQDLMREAMIGAVPGKTVKIELTRVGPGDEPIVYTSFELEETMISGFSYSSSGDQPHESLSLNFTKITYKMSQQETDATTGNPKLGYFDLRTAKGG
jgi:type VI secretion system secreted protein Hcp